MAYTTKENSAAQEQCTIKGTHWVKNMVKTWLNYAFWAKDGVATWTGAHTFSSTVAFSGAITSTSITGFRSTATFVPDQLTTNYAFAVGQGHAATNELDVTMGSGNDQNFDPFQMNVNIKGVNPGNSSTTNLMYAKLTHDGSIAMGNLRLKCADFTVAVAQDVKDVYAYQGEIDITGNCAIGGEACIAGYTMNISAGTVTGAVRGVIIAMYGSSMPAATSMGLFINTGLGATLGNALYIETQGGTTITNGIHLANAGTFTNLVKAGGTITNFLNLDGAGNSGFVTTGGTGTTHTLKIIVPGGADGYIRIFGSA